ncbi:hypothetical protein [Noviherbaspirillum suwonense]|jgi:hypothetical protein|uniref:Uncharacterized protein n=1 Tax=Noviherbaspirillum suwonense TaxID=1224511 RepID=A0ABY1QMV2_9BURK|nr:hypothetical protein [Noviherbaspirillum suwonense]SMP75814.1 hypothetical protein SAMN06295970_12370 [Noviherbaspirillum suwonense]
MFHAHPVTIRPRVIVVDISAQCADAAMLDAAGGAIYGAYHYDAAAPFFDANGQLSYQVYPLAVTPLRENTGFCAERALGDRHPKTGLPLAAAYLERIAERSGPPQAFPDAVLADAGQYRDAYAAVLNDCLRGGFDCLPGWVLQARRHRTLRVRQKATAAGSMAPETFLVDYLAADGSRGCFGIDMRHHVDLSRPRPACASGWSTPSEILQAVEKQFSRCADIDRAQYDAFEVPVHGRPLREGFFWASTPAEDEVLKIARAAPGSARFIVSYLNLDGEPCEVGLRLALHGAARLSGAMDWLDIVVAVEDACASYPGFDLQRYRIADVSDGVRIQREMFLPRTQSLVAERQAA